MADVYFFLDGGSLCFSHRRSASITALVIAPFSVPYNSMTLILNSLCRSSGMTILNLAIGISRGIEGGISQRLYRFMCVSFPESLNPSESRRAAGWQ